MITTTTATSKHTCKATVFPITYYSVQTERSSGQGLQEVHFKFIFRIV